MLAVQGVLHCQARRHGQWWVAHCLELNVAAQGRTLQEARRNLDEAIVLYLEDAAQQRADFDPIPPTPWYRLRLLRWHVLYFAQRIRHRASEHAPVALFEAHAPT